MSEVSVTRYEQLMSDYEDLWNGNFSKRAVVSESVAVYDPAAPGGEVHGRDGFEAFLRDLHEAFPDFRLTIGDTLANDGVVMSEWTGTGTHEGTLNGLPPTGRKMNVMGMAKTSIRDGKIQEDRIYSDQRELFAQLGLTFPTVLLTVPRLAFRAIQDRL